MYIYIYRTSHDILEPTFSGSVQMSGKYHPDCSCLALFEFVRRMGHIEKLQKKKTFYWERYGKGVFIIGSWMILGYHIFQITHFVMWRQVTSPHHAVVDKCQRRSGENHWRSSRAVSDPASPVPQQWHVSSDRRRRLLNFFAPKKKILWWI